MTGMSQDNAPKHFLDVDRFDAGTLRDMLVHAVDMKTARAGQPQGAPDAGSPLKGRLLAMIFERQSTRTRVSFDVAMRQLGGETILLSGTDMQTGRGESVADTAGVLSRYVDAIMIRAASHDRLLELAEHATVPVVNGLTTKSHPCQIMADIMTFEEHKGAIAGRTVAWCGDGNNVAVSWIHAAVKLGFELRLACPEALDVDGTVLNWARAQGGNVTVHRDPRDAVSGADCVVTDAWISMGDTDAASRHNLLKPYQVTAGLMSEAASDSIFMHCLPAHRGEEVTAEVIDGPQSVVFDEAENRLHAQKSILAWCLDGSRPE